MNRRSFFALGIAAAGTSASGNAQEDQPKPEAMRFEEFARTKIENFTCKNCRPEIAIHDLCQMVLKQTGKLIPVQIEEKSNPQSLTDRLALHRLINIDLKATTAMEAFNAILVASYWHWNKTADGGVLVKAWHKPNPAD